MALEEVNKRIREFEEEKARLEAESQGTGVKALGAKNMLAQIESSPKKEELNRVSHANAHTHNNLVLTSHSQQQQALITAEAAVRIASKKYGGQGGGGGAGGDGSSEGAIWWMNRDLQEKQKRYGPSKKA